MSNRITFAVSVCLCSSSAALADPPKPAPFTLKPVVKGVAPSHPYSKAQISRGEFLVRVGGCNDCHTPRVFDPKLGMPTPDMSRMLSGHPEGGPDPLSPLTEGDIGIIGPTFTSFRVPFGVVYAANLTPDVQTGSGAWTEELFLKMFRTGKHLGGAGRPILPPMPWTVFIRQPDEDLKAVFAYLRSLPPLRNAVPDPKVPAPAFESVSRANAAMLAP